MRRSSSFTVLFAPTHASSGGWLNPRSPRARLAVSSEVRPRAIFVSVAVTPVKRGLLTKPAETARLRWSPKVEAIGVPFINAACLWAWISEHKPCLALARAVCRRCAIARSVSLPAWRIDSTGTRAVTLQSTRTDALDHFRSIRRLPAAPASMATAAKEVSVTTAVSMIHAEPRHVLLDLCLGNGYSLSGAWLHDDKANRHYSIANDDRRCS